MRRIAVCFWLGLVFTTQASAQVFQETDYQALAERVDTVLDFEEPAFDYEFQAIHEVWEVGCVTIAEGFVGQSVPGFMNWDKSGVVLEPPLRIAPAPTGLNLVRGNSDQAGSRVLLGVGPKGAFHKEGRGYGAISLLFDQPQSAFGFEVFVLSHSEGKLRFGPLDVSFFDEGAGIIATFSKGLRKNGSIAFERPHGERDIKGVTISNRVPGGISIDNVLVACGT